MTNYGYTLDVAAFQPQAVYYDFWSKWKARGVKGGIVKLTESTWYVNEYAAGQIAAIKHEGLAVSGYHFSRFRGNSYQAVQEANFAIARARQVGLPQGAPLILDYEEKLGYRASNTQAAIAFLKCVKAAGYRPVFYSYSGMANLWDFEAIHAATSAVMWIATYPTLAGVTSPAMGYFPGISNFICAWQFTDNFYGEHIDGSVDLTGVFTGMTQQKITSGGHLDDCHFEDGKLVVAGWFASDKANGKSNHYIIITDDQGHELARQKVELADRPDVRTAYPDIDAKCGFSAKFDYTKDMAGKKVTIYFRYTDDPEGNGNAADFTADHEFNQNLAYLDGRKSTIYTSKLQLNGWHATDLSIGLKYRFLILLADGKEVQRLRVETVDRPDVAGAYPGVYGSGQSGFNGEFDYPDSLVGKKLQLVSRYSDNEGGEGNHVDYWFPEFEGPAKPVLDGKTTNEILADHVTVESVGGKQKVTFS